MSNDINWKIGDFIRVEWDEEPGIYDILRIERDEPETDSSYGKIWCSFLQRKSQKCEGKSDEVWVYPREIQRWINGKLEIIADEKEKLSILLKS